MKNDTEIVYEAMANLAQHSGIHSDWQAGKDVIDGEMTLYIGGKPYRAVVEVKREPRQYQLQDIIRLARRHKRFMIVAEHIFPAIKEQLRVEGIGYLDKAGNLFISDGDTYLWIDGHKAGTRTKKVTNRAFTKTGLKAVFYLLRYPDAINMPYRQLAMRIGIALGNIQNVIEGLRESGFILQLNRQEKMLHNKKALLERWIDGYRETLRPALHIGNYTLWRKDMHWQELQIPDGTTALWGGEPAAEWMTGYLQPKELTLYTDNKGPLITAWAAIPKEKGELKMYERFWEHDDMDDRRVVPAILVYADLMITDDPRCIEAAQMIYNEQLARVYEND